MLTKLFVLTINLVKILLFTETKYSIYKFVDKILKEYDYCNKVMKKYFNKNLVIFFDEEEIFQLSNKCWICDKLFDVGDEKVIDLVT